MKIDEPASRRVVTLLGRMFCTMVEIIEIPCMH
jgi:hypothetical protein